MIYHLMCININLYIYICVYKYIYIYTYIYIHCNVYIYICVCVYIHIYMIYQCNHQPQRFSYCLAWPTASRARSLNSLAYMHPTIPTGTTYRSSNQQTLPLGSTTTFLLRHCGMVVSQGLSWGIPVTKCCQSHATDHIYQAAHSKGENVLHHFLRKAATSGPKNSQQRLQQHLVTNPRGPTWPPKWI